MSLISKNSIGKYEKYSDSTKLSPELLNEVERALEVLDQGPPVSLVHFLIRVDNSKSRAVFRYISKTCYTDGTRTFKPALIKIAKETDFIRFM